MVLLLLRGTDMTTIGIIAKHKPRSEVILNRFILSCGITDISTVSVGSPAPMHSCGVYIIEEPIKGLSEILNGAKGVIITADEFLRTSEPLASEAYIISCSLGTRATVTASSIGDGGFTYCIQREFSDINKTAHPPQEFCVRGNIGAEDIYLYLSAVTALIVCGISADKLTDFTF